MSMLIWKNVKKLLLQHQERNLYSKKGLDYQDSLAINMQKPLMQRQNLHEDSTECDKKKKERRGREICLNISIER